jgi:hypothetical protein
MAPSLSRRSVITGGVAALAASSPGALARRPPSSRGITPASPRETPLVFSQSGGGCADIVTRHVKGYQAIAEPSNGAVGNIIRVLSGNSEIG